MPPVDSPRSEPARWRRWIPTPKVLILGVVAAVIAYLAIVPLYYLFWGTFFDASGLTFSGFERAYGNDQIYSLVGNSLWFAAGSAVVSLVIGTALAYLNVRTDVPFKALFFAASIIPLVIPGILYTIAWILLGSPDIGLINHYLEPIFGRAVIDVFSIWGMIWVEGLQLSPIVFLLMVASFRSMDPSLEESALMSGARMGRVVRHITLPLVLPALAAAVLVMMVRTLEAFEVPAILGRTCRCHTFVSRIFRLLQTFPPKYGQAGALSMSLLLFTTVGVFLQSRLSKRGKAFQTVTGKGFRPRPLPLGRWRWPATGFVLVYFLIAVVMPVLILVYSSTQPFYTAPSVEAFGRASLENYVATFTRPQSLTALRNSLVLGIGSATAAMFLMAIASWLVVRTRLRGRWLVDNLAFTPLVIPGLVMGVALLFVYLRFPLPIYGTLWILFIAYLTRYMPYGMRYATTSMYQISGELEESAQTSGASWWQTFRRINLPLLMPGLIAGWIYIVLVSFRELSASILLYSPGNEVLSILIWERWENGQFTQLAALGIVMIATLVLLVVIATRLGARIGVKEH
jgi:iron(III) transport system permease protein